MSPHVQESWRDPGQVSTVTVAPMFNTFMPRVHHENTCLDLGYFCIQHKLRGMHELFKRMNESRHCGILHDAG